MSRIEINILGSWWGTWNKKDREMQGESILRWIPVGGRIGVSMKCTELLSHVTAPQRVFTMGEALIYYVNKDTWWLSKARILPLMVHQVKSDGWHYLKTSSPGQQMLCPTCITFCLVPLPHSASSLLFSQVLIPNKYLVLQSSSHSWLSENLLDIPFIYISR